MARELSLGPLIEQRRQALRNAKGQVISSEPRLNRRTYIRRNFAYCTLSKLARLHAHCTVGPEAENRYGRLRHSFLECCIVNPLQFR